MNPPPPVQASFNEVNQAQQERERMINEANGEYNKEVPRSRGVADQKIQAAQGYALKRVNEALGDVARFNAMYGEYKKAPEVTKTRLYWESMKEMVPKMGKKIILDEDASQILPLLQLNQDGRRSLDEGTTHAILLSSFYSFLSMHFCCAGDGKVIITQFGKPVGEPKTEAAFILKFLFRRSIESKRLFMEWSVKRDVCKDKTYLIIDTLLVGDSEDNVTIYFESLRDEGGLLSRG